MLADRDWTHPQGGGSGANLHEQVRRWLAAGHRVSVICCRYRGCLPVERDGALTIHRVGGRSTVFPRAIWRQSRGRLVPDADVVLEVVNGITFLTPLWLRTPRVVLIHHIHRRHYVEEMGRWRGRLAALCLETLPLRLLYGQARFLNRVWSLVVGGGEGDEAKASMTEADLRRAVHHAIKEVTEDLEAFRFNTAIAELMTLQGALSKARAAGLAATDTWREGVRTLLKLLAPIAPHITEELWHRLGEEGSVHLQSWPEHDPAALVVDTVTMAVQVNGKVRGQIEAPREADKDAVLALARAEQNVARYLEGKEVAREIVVPGRLVSFVVK